MNNAENLPSADVKGTGWRVSENSGRKWYRIERGSPEFVNWMKFFRLNGKQSFANFVLKYGHTFVMGPDPLSGSYGNQQLAYMASQNVGGNQ